MITIAKMEQGEKIYLNYTLNIPANLEHNENLYSSLCTYYNNNTEIGSIQETSTANIIGLSTGIGARAKINLSCGIDAGTKFTEGQKVKYTIEVQNTGEMPAENVVIKNPIPKWTSYVEETVVKNEIETFNKYTYYSSENELRWEIGKMEAGQKAELEYTVVINNMPNILEYYGMQEGFTEENGKYYIVSKDETTGQDIKTEITELPEITIQNIASLESTSIEKSITSNELKNGVARSYFNIREESSIAKAVYIEENQEFNYTVIVENKQEVAVNNVEISKKIPEGVTYINSEIKKGSGDITYNQEQKALKVMSSEIAGNDVIEVIVRVIANKLPDGEYKKQIETNTEVKAENTETNQSSSVKNTIGKPKITAKLDCDVKQKYIYEKDILNYTITITNENDMTASNLQISNIIPENTTFISGSYEKNGRKYTILSNGSNIVTVNTNLTQGTIVVNIKARVEKVTADVEELEIEDTASIEGNNVENTTIGQIRHTILKAKDDGNNGGNNNGGNQDGNNKPNGGEIGDDGIERYKVKGLVWNDENKDGQRQDEEAGIAGIEVYLINEKGEIVKDYKTGDKKIAKTNIYGEYEFRNVEKGKYIVAFMYDNTLYNITEYQKTGVINDRNSDAILKTINLEGNKIETAVTDIIEVTDRSMYSIDLGLKEKEKFNMKLDAGISNITIKTSQGIQQISYDMASLAKIEIKASQLNGTTVIIEYNVKVTNNGEIPGSIIGLMANKPNGLIFSSETNKNWYEGNDKNLYVTGYNNQIINPGESTNIKLILAKQMTANNTGTIENSFSLTKTYNEKGQEETTLEDNTKSVTCIIMTSTGKMIAYTGIATLAFAILAIRSICN